MMGTVLDNFIVLLRNVFILELRAYFILFSTIMPESDMKQQTIWYFISAFLAKSLGPPRKKWTFSVFVFTGCMVLTYSSTSLLQSLLFTHKGRAFIFTLMVIFK